MTEEELFKKNFPEYVTEKGECLSPYWDLFSAGIECATYELNKGCIQTLTKENAELKGQVEMSYEVYNNNLDYSHHIEEQLTKAKEIIEELYNIIPASMADYAKEPMEHARKFMKEE